jgi:hypothetical protein
MPIEGCPQIDNQHSQSSIANQQIRNHQSAISNLGHDDRLLLNGD